MVHIGHNALEPILFQFDILVVSERIQNFRMALRNKTDGSKEFQHFHLSVSRLRMMKRAPIKIYLYLQMLAVQAQDENRDPVRVVQYMFQADRVATFPSASSSIIIIFRTNFMMFLIQRMKWCCASRSSAVILSSFMVRLGSVAWPPLDLEYLDFKHNCWNRSNNNGNPF